MSNLQILSFTKKAETFVNYFFFFFKIEMPIVVFSYIPAQKN